MHSSTSATKVKLEKEINIPVNNHSITGNLNLPKNALSLIIFSHGSGSSRFSPRNQMVAERLTSAGYGTFLCDLLTEPESMDEKIRFNIELLSQRLQTITRWFTNHVQYSKLNIAYFGASTGAASAMKASLKLPGIVKAVVSRGGRPDLINEDLQKIISPTFFIVGELDFDVTKLNLQAFKKLNCDKQFVIVPGASHLFEEPGKLEDVSELAIRWFHKYVPVSLETINANRTSV